MKTGKLLSIDELRGLAIIEWDGQYVLSHNLPLDENGAAPVGVAFDKWLKTESAKAEPLMKNRSGLENKIGEIVSVE